MKYAAIFTIEIQHDYFHESLPKLLRIVPTERTEQALRDAGLIAKFLHNKLYILAKHSDASSPLISIPNDLRLQFLLEVTDPNFARLSNFHQPDPYRKKLYLSNLPSINDQNDKSVDGVLYLHERLPLFDASQAYAYNDLLRNAAGDAFECLRKVTAGSGDLSDSAQFRPLGKVSYAAPSSSLLFSGPELNMDVETPDSELNISYFAFNEASNLYDKKIKEEQIGLEQNPTGENIEAVSLSFRFDDQGVFPEGIYKVTIDSQTVWVYFRPENDWQACIGLIDLHHSDRVSTDYSFLKADGFFFMLAPANEEVDTREYIIRFAPAQYLMKYKCSTNKVLGISDEAGTISFNSIGSNSFLSSTPVRMSEKAIDTIKVQYDGADDIKKIKNPGYRRLSLTDDENRYLVSETYLNL